MGKASDDQYEPLRKARIPTQLQTLLAMSNLARYRGCLAVSGVACKYSVAGPTGLLVTDRTQTISIEG